MDTKSSEAVAQVDGMSTLLVVSDDPTATFAIRVPDLTPDKLKWMDAEARRGGMRIVVAPSEVKDFSSCDQAMVTMDINELEAPQGSGDDPTHEFKSDHGGLGLFWMCTGEGRNGDFDINNPSDSKMLRATLTKDEMPVMDGSILTGAAEDTSPAILKGMSQDLFNPSYSPRDLLT